MMSPHCSLQYLVLTVSYEVDVVIEKHNHFQDQVWEVQKIEHVALENYQQYICFVFKFRSTNVARE